MLVRRLRAHMPTLIGAGLLSLPLDGLILLFRLIGLSRPTAVYTGLLAFVALGSLLARHYFGSHPSKPNGADEHV